MKRLVLVLVCLAVALIAPGASAAPCFAKITTYYGHYAIDGSTFCYWGGSPPQTPQIIGETTRDCNGQLSSWGNTSCDDYPPTVEYIDCDCRSANETEDEANPAECAAERATD
ncbi:MAG TPA: hypothetical protein VGF28_01005 [Thermoanaerobaculia bacterium]|jgi:hypothetical protein